MEMEMEMKKANAIFAIEMTDAIDMVLELSIQQRGGGGSKSNWEGMMKWWIPAHVDGGHGTYRPDFSDRTHNGRADPPKWRGLAKRMFMTKKPPHEDYCIEERVYDIASNISVGHDLIKPLAFEEVMDELQAYADDGIDVFQVLDSDRCLYPILRVLFNQHAPLRAKAAQLITTMVEMNPENAELVIEGGGLQLLVYNLMKDPDATSKTKALGAVVAILRNNKPSVIVFRLANGYAALTGLLSSSKWVVLHRDALKLIGYLLLDNSSDCDIVTELGIPCIMRHLSESSDDAKVQIAALECLLVLGWKDDNIHPILEKLLEIRSLAAAETADGNSLSQKEDPLGFCPPSAATPTYQSNSSSKRKKLD